MEKIRVLVAGKQTLVRKGICALLESCENIEVAGEAANGNELVTMIDKESPDVVLMDTTLPVADSASMTRRTRKEGKKPRILFLSENEDKESIMRGIKAGSNGYILKEATPADLLSAIVAVHSGGYFLYPSVAKRVVEEYISVGKGRESNSYDQLSNREKEVLKLIAEGRRSQQIAQILDVSPMTVQRHRANLMRKLDIHNQTEVVKYAIRKHLIEMEA